MALEYLADNAVSLAAASWLLVNGSAGTGFANGATLRIDRGTQTIDQDTNQSASDVESLDVLPGFSGNLGTGSSPVRFGASGTAESATNVTSRFRYWAGGGSCYYDSGTLCDFLQVDTGGFINLIAGDYKHLHLDNGRAYFNSTATCGASGVWQVGGGQLLLDQHASDLFVTMNVTGSGSQPHELKRGGATLNLRGGTTILDVKNGSVTTLEITGGTLTLKSHNATGSALTALGGVLDFSQISRPITFTNAVLGRVRLVGYDKSLVTFTTPSIVGRGPIGLN